MTRLSVNINKVRNARGENVPDVVRFAADCERFGAQGITVHPRPDERHIRRSDVYALKEVVDTEFNIEGYPAPEFLDLVEAVRPAQCTLVPDAASLAGICARLRGAGVRSSIFVAADPEQIRAAAAVGADRVELYTKPYADGYARDRGLAVEPFVKAAEAAREAGLGLNAGHDLNLQNLRFFARNIPWLDEVSIGHAIISDALYLGIERTIQEYLDCLRP